MSLASLVAAHGGIIATHELIAAGWTDAGLRWAVRTGALTRIRKGWYCEPTLDPSLQRAARVGGRVTCESLAEHLGLWVPFRDGRLHVAVLPDRTQLRRHDRHVVRRSEHADPFVHVHWTARRTGTRTDAGLTQMLVDLDQCREPWFVFVVAESALHRGVMSTRELLDACSRLPRDHARSLSAATALSESGGESLFALLLREHGLPFRQQAWIGRDRVDFLVGERLVVEIDGRAFHDVARDNRRDARLVTAGRHVLHFDSNMVLHDRAIVAATLLTAIARNEHRW